MRSAKAQLGLELGGMTLHCREQGVLVQMFVRAGNVAITKVQVVNPQDRGKGLARRVLTEICDWADRYGHTLGICQDGRWGADVARLTRFYESLGFVANPEQPQRFRVHEAMIRRPSARDGHDRFRQKASPDPATRAAYHQAGGRESCLYHGIDHEREEVTSMKAKDDWTATPLGATPGSEDESEDSVPAAPDAEQR